MFRIYPKVILSVLLVMSFSVGYACAQEKICLQYDDDSQDSKKSMTGAAHGISFSCPDDEQWYLTSVAVYGSRYGSRKAPREDFSIVVASEDMKSVASFDRPYSLFERSNPDWIDIEVPGVEVSKNFKVVVSFEPTRTRGVYVGIDQDSSPSHSMTVVANETGKSKSDVKGDWMIRAYLTKKPGKKTTPMQSLDGAAAELAEKESKADAKLLGETKSMTLKHDDDEMESYMNIQGACYTVEHRTPKDVEAYVWQVQLFASQFGGNHESEAVNGDIYILDKDRKIISRTSFPYSLLSRKHKWVSIPTLPTLVKGKFYVSFDAHGQKNKGVYLGYVTTDESGLASTDELGRGKIKPAKWSAKFKDKQWMIRAKVADRPVVYRSKD